MITSHAESRVAAGPGARRRRRLPTQVESRRRRPAPGTVWAVSAVARAAGPSVFLKGLGVRGSRPGPGPTLTITR